MSNISKQSTVKTILPNLNGLKMLYDKKSIDDKNEVFENRIIYSLPVRLGLWNEDLALREEKIMRTRYRRDHCQLLTQKTKKMLDHLLKPTSLANEQARVIYGEYYQIRTCDVKVAGCTNGLFVSGLLTEKEIDSTQHFRHGCVLTASPIKEKYVRNTFRIVGDKGEKSGETVNMGDDVLIQIVESEGPPLYIQCENSTIDTFGSHMSLRLSQVPDIYCRFKVLHWNPQMRPDTSGTSFQPDSRVIIQHSASGQNLAVETNSWIPTFFGPECMISCHTYRDTHKMETAENFWMFVSAPKCNTNLFVRAAKGEDIPLDIFE